MNQIKVNWSNEYRRKFRSHGYIDEQGNFIYNGNWEAVNDRIKTYRFHSFEGIEGRTEVIPAGEFEIETELKN